MTSARPGRRTRDRGGRRNWASRMNGRKLLLLVLGWFFLALGVLGLFLPILQGILFILIGLMLLSSVSPRVRLLRQRLRRRYPRAFARVHEAETRAKAWLRRLIPGGRSRSP